MEAEAYSALLHAFLGPGLGHLQPGQLPDCFEAEVRRSPADSEDLLHLVSGRTLLGLVRKRRQPLLPGDWPRAGALGAERRGLLAGQRADGSVAAPAAPAAAAEGVERRCGSQCCLGGSQRKQQWAGQAAAASAAGATPGAATPVSAAEFAALFGCQPDGSDAPGERQQLLGHQGAAGSAAAAGASASAGCAASSTTGSVYSSSLYSSSSGMMYQQRSGSGRGSSGGSSDGSSWSLEGPQPGHGVPRGVRAGSVYSSGSGTGACSVDAAQQQEAGAGCTQHHTQQRQQEHEQEQGQEQHQEHQQQHHHHHQQQHQQQQHQQEQQQPEDPLAAITPESDHTTVLELLIGGCLAAAAVRADALPGRPLKVYREGEHVATLEGRLLLDAQDELLAAVMHGRSPGVVHMRLLRLHRPARLLARMSWASLPPSGAWLFPARCATHDVGGWYVEWEGHGREGREGWVHPAVFVLLAGFETLALEERREARRGLKEAVAGRVAGWWRRAAGAAGAEAAGAGG